MPVHRVIVMAWHVIVLAQLLWAFFIWRDGGDVHWLWISLFAIPLLALFASVATMQPSHRSVAYWVLAGASIPNAASGLSSITGWMFIVSIVILIWAARRENPGD